MTSTEIYDYEINYGNYPNTQEELIQYLEKILHIIKKNLAEKKKE
jgi:hypothetical protein